MRTKTSNRPCTLPPATSRAAFVLISRTPRLHSPRHPARAFSLVELVVVVGILAVLSSIALVRYSNALAQYRISVTTDKIVADLEWAKARARTTSSDREVRFAPNASGYGIPAEKLRPKSSSPYMVDLSSEPYRAKLLAATFGASSNVTFNAYGLPSSAGTVRISVGSITRTIRISAGGVFSVQTP